MQRNKVVLIVRKKCSKKKKDPKWAQMLNLADKII